MTDESLALLRQIAADVQALRAAFERRPDAVPTPDVAAPLVQAIAATCGDLAFSAAELVRHAALPEFATLRAALIAAVGELNARRIGKWLRKVEGVDLGGLRVIRLALDRDGVVWQIVRVCAFETRKPASPVSRSEDSP
jgi:hypothetical protein